MAKSHTPWLWSSNPLPTRLSTSFAAYSPGNWEDSWTSQKKKKKDGKQRRRPAFNTRARHSVAVWPCQLPPRFMTPPQTGPKSLQLLNLPGSWLNILTAPPGIGCPWFFAQAQLTFTPNSTCLRKYFLNWQRDSFLYLSFLRPFAASVVLIF